MKNISSLFPFFFVATYLVSAQLHVDKELAWSGDQPEQDFVLVEKLGEGYVEPLLVHIYGINLFSYTAPLEKSTEAYTNTHYSKVSDRTLFWLPSLPTPPLFFSQYQYLTLKHLNNLN